MTTLSSSAQGRAPRPGGGFTGRLVGDREDVKRKAPAGVTFIALVAIIVVCGILQPVVFSATGLNLVLSSIVPLVVAALAQMVMMSVGDIDLGIGAFIGTVTTVAATFLSSSPALGILVLAALVAGYGVLAVLVHVRKVPSLIATLGASFIWYGIGLFVLPTPGGDAPKWLLDFAAWTPNSFPVPVIPIVIITAVVWIVMRRSTLGASIRALGSNPLALGRSGISPLRTRVIAYLFVGVLGVVSGLLLSSQIGGGDATSANSYTLVSVAAVILGGGAFTGGRAVAWGCMFGALTLGLVSVLLSLLDLSSNIQPAIQGGIVIAALAGRLAVEKVLK
ncbi:ABC transporter permease [Frondihabitans australicus]|uniref:Autoinducer 2 import system permease protein LsrD n=1 Tax=Frondihabitans australicus TaxID=386892 RepID=A0A495IJ85_9MICO|nr:ABC transporter permease [Frondihabitans australicus]RKR75176.1 ribose transport system permease protein [Frondihabitans australicus]